MNGDPLSAFYGGEPSSSRRRSSRRLLLSSSPPAAAEDMSNFDAMFAGVSLRSLLLDDPVVSSSPSPFSSSSSPSPLWSPLPSPLSPYSPSPEQQLQLQQQQQLSFRCSPSPLKMPKQEPGHGFPDFAPGPSRFNSPSLAFAAADDSTLCFPSTACPTSSAPSRRSKRSRRRRRRRSRRQKRAPARLASAPRPTQRRRSGPEKSGGR
ncbi:putative protein TPRXL [Eucalyptus grandis]|uniref:putative protein TPRXL n=1 Tax=Eucalyptus grandis TaxID=71139 RepID=UPI00192EA3DD|nr:putative protein TPRXL [Eucalyptus grandis]